jgi:ArsR family transcriptional regulator, arsenate/arsenite/antimonite-responsive transcriptional repressor
MIINEYNHIRRTYMNLVQLLKALSDETRIRILNILKDGELCVCEIEEILEINQSNVSRHLEKLRNIGLITYEKRAQWVYYGLNERMLSSHPFIRLLLDDELIKIDRCNDDNKKYKKHKECGVTCEDLDCKCK